MADPLPRVVQSWLKSPPRHFWRFVMWPISVWMSFRQFSHHPADDYVEQTSPIMGAAIVFWLLAGWIVVVVAFNGLFADFQMLLWVTPLAYIIGLLLYLNRERYFSDD